MNTYRHLDRTKIQFDFLNVYDGDIAFSDEILSLGGRILSLKLKRRNGLMSYYKGIKRFFAEHRGEFFGIHMNILDPVNLDLLRYGKKYGIPLRILHVTDEAILRHSFIVFGVNDSLAPSFDFGPNHRLHF